MRASWWRLNPSESAMMNHTLSTTAATSLRAPKTTVSPAARVTAKATSTSQPQAWPPMPNPSAVNPAPISAKPAVRDARFAKPPPGSSSHENSKPNNVLSRYCSYPIAQNTTRGTSATSRKNTPRGQLNPAESSANTWDNQLATLPP